MSKTAAHTLVKKELLQLLPEHRKSEKRSLTLTLDELIDDYRKMHDMSPSDLDFLFMAYRYEYPFQEFLKNFSDKKIKPPEIIDLWRMAFASLLTRKEENLPQLTHAWVEASKKFFGTFTSSLSNAFCRKVLREKQNILDHCAKNPDFILGPTLAKRWAPHPELRARFAENILERPAPGISAILKDGEFELLDAKSFVPGTHLAMTYASQAWVKKLCETAKEHFRAKSDLKLIDMCAAPGGKLIATLNFFDTHTPMKVTATAVESKFKRLERLKSNLEAWKLQERVKTLLHDWSQDHAEIKAPYDILLVDLPCTGLGTLPSRPDLLLKDWQYKESDLFRVQEQILKAASMLMAPYSLLFVSICSSDPSEVQHLSTLLDSAPSFQAELIKDSSEEITGWVIIKK